MNSDLEVFIKMITTAGISFTKDEVSPVSDPNDIKYVIGIESGYVGFYTEIQFDQDGKLKFIGAYE